ncbi:MAG: ester cyclase [Thermomicrobiales bacterium]
MEICHNKTRYLLYIDRCSAHEFGTLGEFVAADVRVNGEACGLEKYIEGLSDIAAAFPNFHWRIEQLLAEGDWLAARFTDTGTHRIEPPGDPATGRIIIRQELAMYRLVGGKIADVWGDLSLAEMEA